MRNFGIECEVQGGTADILEHLGLDRLHSYHCSCSRCEPSRSGPDWTGQQDCTSDGEFISRILTYGSEEANAAIDNLGTALRLSRAIHSDGSSGRGVNGVHIHVDGEGVLRDQTSLVHLWRLFFAHESELADIARGKYHDVRSYNPGVVLSSVCRDTDTFWNGHPLDVSVGTPWGRAWLNLSTGHGTIEFRLWNATRMTWRLHLYAGVSVAMVQAAADGVNAHPDDEASLFDRLSPYFTPQTNAAYLRFLYGKDKDK